jgi:predicted permease
MWPSKRHDPRVRDEIRFHRDRLIEDHVASGMNRKEAERRAFLEFGNVAQIEEVVRDIRGRWRNDFVQDLRYALRTLRRSPGFAAAAILSLALGIGANVAIFTLINAVMLRALPVKEPGRLVQITRLTAAGGPGSVSYPIFEYFRDNLTSVSAVFAQGTTDQSIVIDREEDFVSAELVSGSYFSVLGLEPAAGRLLVPQDDVLSPEAPAAVISDRFWQRRFGRSPAAIGTTFTIRDRVFTIVGVTPSSYQSARTGHAPDLMLPMLITLSETQRREPTNNWLNMLGRLKPGVTVEQADAEVQVVWNAFQQSQAAHAPDKERAGVLRQRAKAFPAPDGVNLLRYDFSRSLLILMGIVALVLLLACVNLSGLLLARAAARQREISIRLAMGASRGRLVRQFLTESLLLAGIGGGVGIVIANWFSARLVALIANGSNVVLSVAPDWRVLVFTMAVSLAACVGAGLAPALHAIRGQVNPGLKEVRATGHGRLSKTLVVAQLAISMVLIVGATLFLGTLVKLYSVDRGFDSDGLLVVSVRSTLPLSAARGLAVQAALVEALRKMPGVQSAAAAQVLPIGGGLWNRSVRIEGYMSRPQQESDGIGFNVISPRYFETLATPLLIGREFDERDSATAPKVAIVNESFARRFFGDGQALGRHVTSLDTAYEIVGVVRDAKYQNLRVPILETMYIPWMQREGDPPSRYNYLVRAASGDPMTLAPALARLVREVDPLLRVRNTITYATQIDRSIVRERILATLGGFFGMLALLVAAVGMFGVLAFQVTRRSNEFGVRLALGASPRTITGLVIRDVALMLAVGIAIGGAAALTLAGFASKMLFGLTPTDPSVFAVSALVLAAVAVVAGWLPARRASHVDPLVSLRHE